jgi:PucR-like helix-turn-helix protein/diguanylate cyclase with GGDEF domain
MASPRPTAKDFPSEAAVGNGVDLERLIAELGPGLVELVVAPHGTNVTVSGASIVVPNEPAAIVRDELVLAAGVKGTSRRAVSLMGSLGEASAAAVAFKLPAGEAPPDLVEAARGAGVAVLAVDPEIVWTQLYSFIRTVMASSGTSSAEAGHTAIGDLFALANAVASMVGGPVTIEDVQSNVLAYSTLDEEIDEPRRKAILGRRVPTLNQQVLKSAGVFKTLWSSDDVIRVDDVGMPDPMRPRLVIAIRAGSEPLGSIWVQEGEAPFDESSEAALRDAARIAALHLVHYRYRDDFARRQRGEFALRLLEGSAARGLGAAFADESHYAVVAIEIDTGDPVQEAIRRERTLDLVRLYCDTFRHKSLEVIVEGVVYVILGLRTSDAGGAYRLAEHVRSHPDNGSAVVTAAIGSVVTRLRDIPRSRDDADKTLRVLKIEAERRVAGVDDVAPQAFLLAVRDAAEADARIHAGLLRPLLDQDGERHTNYVETIRAYLAFFGDLPRAAAAIGVHPNTFRYRLKRACEAANVDLSDPIVRLALELELHWLYLEDVEGEAGVSHRTREPRQQASLRTAPSTEGQRIR